MEFLNVKETKTPTLTYLQARKPETTQKASTLQDEAEGVQT